MGPTRLHTQVNQPRFLASGNDLDRRADRQRCPFDKFGLVARVAHRAGSYGPHPDYIQLLILLGHARQHRAGQFQRLLCQ